MPPIEPGPAPGAYDGAYDPAAPEAAAPVDPYPEQGQLDALWNVIMANATSLYHEAFSQTQEAEKDDDEE